MTARKYRKKIENLISEKSMDEEDDEDYTEQRKGHRTILQFQNRITK